MSGSAERSTELTPKSHRRSLSRTFLIDPICSGDGEVPLDLRVADGNEADWVGFGQVVEAYRHQWQFEGFWVADAALYTAENLKQLAGLKWISRVPLTLAEAQEVIRQVLPFAEWQGLAAGDRLIEVWTTDAGVTQRWVVVASDQRREADLKQLHKRLRQDEQCQPRQLDKLSKDRGLNKLQD